MKKNLIAAVRMTIATTVLLGILYPLVVTGLAQLIFPKQSNGQLIQRDGLVIGSRLIGQLFSTCVRHGFAMTFFSRRVATPLN
jgi:K+-transporting ATPase ATPase C chain